ncbi:MAG: NAD(P)H-hydrate epimerase, partial [Burkholderiales bacterium]
MTFHARTSLPVYRTADLREIEGAAAAARPSPPLMERAGLAAAQIARNVAADRGQGVLVVAGPGNNGGDAFVVARHLQAWWHKVDVVFAGDAERLPADAKAALAAWQESGGSMQAHLPAQGHWDLVIDGLFGIGLKRELSGEYAALVGAINQLGTRVLALDVPSGLDSDGGCVRGCAVRADHTATFIGLKAGLLTGEGPDYCGEIHLCGLDLTQSAGAHGATIGSDVLRSVLPARRAHSHKGDYGSLGILGGAPGMAGAALLAGRAALQLGAGRVYIGMLAKDNSGYDPLQPELMLRPAHEIGQLEHLNCYAIGPGLGQTPDARHLVADTLRLGKPTVIDADALNLLATDGTLKQLLLERSAPAVLTPHPAEAARLLARDTASVQ